MRKMSQTPSAIAYLNTAKIAARVQWSMIVVVAVVMVDGASIIEKLFPSAAIYTKHKDKKHINQLRRSAPASSIEFIDSGDAKRERE